MNSYTLYGRAPVVPEAIADDLIYAFAQGWITLPATLPRDDTEASERLTRLHLVRRFAEASRGVSGVGDGG